MAYHKGDWLACCQVCGGEFRASQLMRRWDNLWVCRTDFEVRHPQESLRAVKDDQLPPWTSPEPTDYFLDVNEITRDNLEPGNKPVPFIWKDQPGFEWLDDDDFNFVDT